MASDRSKPRPWLLVAGCLAFLAIVSWRVTARWVEYRAQDLLWQRSPGEAAAMFAKAAALDPWRASALVGEADAVFDRGEGLELAESARIADLETAIGLYREAILRAPADAYSWAQLGRAYSSLAVSRRAAEPIDISRLGEAADLRLSEDAWAIAALKRSVELEPNNYDFINFVAELLHARGDPEAIEWYRRGTRTLPKILLHRYLENPYLPKEIVDAAVAGATEAVGTDNVVPDTKILEELSLFHAKRGEYDAAIAVNRRAMDAYEAISANNPSTAWLWTREGLWLEELGKDEPAREAFQKALEIDPSRASAHYALGRLEARLDHLDAAIESLRKARDQAPLDSRFQMELARTLEQAGHLEQAANEYERASRIEGSEIRALLALVNLYRGQGIYDRAIQYARQLVDREPGEPAFQRQLDELNAKLRF